MALKKKVHQLLLSRENVPGMKDTKKQLKKLGTSLQTNNCGNLKIHTKFQS